MEGLAGGDRPAARGGAELYGSGTTSARAEGVWTSEHLEQGFLELQGELAPFSHEEGGSAQVQPAEQEALRQRVRDLSTSAISLFRSRMQLACRQQQRKLEEGGGGLGGEPKRGLLVLFEGLDRSGKGTQVQMLGRALEVVLFFTHESHTHAYTNANTHAYTHACTPACTPARAPTHLTWTILHKIRQTGAP